MTREQGAGPRLSQSKVPVRRKFACQRGRDSQRAGILPGTVSATCGLGATHTNRGGHDLPSGTRVCGQQSYHCVYSALQNAVNIGANDTGVELAPVHQP
ncbi:hypothetical protein FA95DRAFT_1552812 [Auriscalpium vulgare]|uniref:Uncharacterized protein n=1 Tax=Auriscalpium vulgare TaxID=40419 RepID=A0ACB8S9X8_9AGAM|nr:hypothetical protein FA95DRAFT_1552812 [Auriscalpium vulgare]